MTRTVYPELPPRVEYTLTDVGQGLRPVLEAMNAWAMTVPRIDRMSEVDEAMSSGAITARTS